MSAKLARLTTEWQRLPGISRKQAERLAYYWASQPKAVQNDLVAALANAQSVHECTQCFNFTDEQVCAICQDKNRQLVLVVVASPLDVLKFEATQEFKPYYHVLHGLIDVAGKVTPESLRIAPLVKRASAYREVILALAPNLEGIVTANFVSKALGVIPKLRVTQLAQGIPLGAAMEYVDELTLKAALTNRKEVK